MYWRIEYLPLLQPLNFTAKIDIKEQSGNKFSNTEISYSLCMQKAKKQPLKNYCLQILKTKPKLKCLQRSGADDVIQLLAEPLLDVELILDDLGHPLEIRNYSSIWKIWNEHTRPFIEASYKGEWVNAIIQKTNAIMLRPGIVFNLFMQDIIIQQYFAGVYHKQFQYGKTSAANNYSLYNVLKGHAVPVKEQWEYKATATGCIIKMSCNPNTLHQPTYEYNEMAQVVKGCSYIMDEKTGWCTGFTSALQITTGTVYSKKIASTLILNTEQHGN